MEDFNVLSVRFEQITMDCVALSKPKRIYSRKLYIFLKAIKPSPFLLMILNNYYVHVFRPADQEFSRLLLENDSDIVCSTIAHDIVERKVKDLSDGEFSF
jgi:hypothetical protein